MKIKATVRFVVDTIVDDKYLFGRLAEVIAQQLGLPIDAIVVEEDTDGS